jgi:L-fucose isomerase-like protein
LFCVISPRFIIPLIAANVLFAGVFGLLSMPYHMVYLTGEGLKTDLRQNYMPALDVRIDGSMDDLIANISGQHYAIAYGDLSSELDDLARILGIQAKRI